MARCNPSQREIVYERHYRVDRKTVRDFIEKEWPPRPIYRRVDIGSMVTISISTSLRSSVLLLSVGLHVFALSTTSKNELHPWIITQDVEHNEALARHITEEWQKMAVPNGKRQWVDTIAKHIVYDFTNVTNEKSTPPQMRPLTCDENANVRLRIEDLQIWSHPRRDEPLNRVLKEQEGFKRSESKLKRYPQTIRNISENVKIEQSLKQERLIAEKEKFKGELEKFYNDYYCKLEEKCIPMSYKFPTVQLALETGDGQTDDRYGDTVSGYYPTTANEVHQKFPVDNNLQEYPLPTMEMVCDKLLGDSGLVYRDIFQD